eukprot:Rmarinus@m.30119
MSVKNFGRILWTQFLHDYGVWPVAGCALYAVGLASAFSMHHFLFSPDVSVVKPMPFLQVDENTHTAGRFIVDHFANGAPALLPSSRSFIRNRWQEECRNRVDGPSPYGDFELKEEDE